MALQDYAKCLRHERINVEAAKRRSRGCSATREEQNVIEQCKLLLEVATS